MLFWCAATTHALFSLITGLYKHGWKLILISRFQWLSFNVYECFQNIIYIPLYKFLYVPLQSPNYMYIMDLYNLGNYV